MTLQELLEATAQGTLPDLLGQRGDELTPELASEARELFKQAAGAGNLDLAQVAAIAAAHAWMRIGDRPKGLVNYIDSLQVDYLRAETPDAYAQAREGLLQARAMGDEIEARDQAFKASTIAADCSFWATQATRPPGRDGLLLQTMADIVSAGELADPDLEADFERYVSLLVAAANEAMATVWADQLENQANDLLRQLAAAADRTVPVSFSYRQVGDPEKTAETARVLASLADAHGV
jgi:hypothetical protein